MALVQAAVRRLARPVQVRVLHPDPALDRRTVSIPEMARSSGGEQLTGAILLYCTLARVRGRSRGLSRRASSVLILDNPIGRASRVRFLELQRLHWVVQCRNVSRQQVEFLRRVHDGFVNGMFHEPAPLKYRSLQLTGDEKMLASLSTTSLFGPSRLTLELLACLPDALPLAWEAVGDGGRMVIFENAGPFAVARRVLIEMKARSYDLIAYGGGRSILAALGHIKTIERSVDAIHYVGDLDHAGLDIAWGARRSAKELGLPAVVPAGELHRQMLSAAESFGHPQGWPAQERFADFDRTRILDVLSPGVRGHVDAILKAGRRIPEEVLGPDELRRAWAR